LNKQVVHLGFIIPIAAMADVVLAVATLALTAILKEPELDLPNQVMKIAMNFLTCK